MAITQPPPPAEPKARPTETVYLGHALPLAQTTARWLLNGCADGLIDLSATLVIVPTANSGRLLRAALADSAASSNRGVLPPTVQTPEQFLHSVTLNQSNVPLIAPMESLLLWSRILRYCQLRDFPAVFPATAEQTAQWALGIARRIVELQSFLADGGMDIAAAARHPATEPERARWQQLAALDQLYQHQLQQLQKTDEPRQRLLTAEQPSPPTNIHRIVLAAVADPLPLTIHLLANLVGQIPVSLLLAADEAERTGFDPWGRPLPGYWTARLNIPDWRQHVHLCANPAELADQVVQLTGPAPGNDVAVAVCDPDAIPSLERSFEKNGLTTFDPAGTPAGRNSLSRLLQLLHQTLRERSTQSLAELLQQPLFAHRAAAETRASAQHLRDALDRFRQRHLCTSLDTALQVARQTQVPDAEQPSVILRLLTFATDVIASLQPGHAFASSLNALLARLYQGHVFRSSAEKTVLETIERIQSTAAEIASAAGAEIFSAAELLALTLSTLDTMRIPSAHTEDAVVLYGWLETLWAAESYLLITGCNEGSLPSTIANSDFLPESVRQAMGLQSNAQRLERDAWYCHTLLRQRQGRGRIDFLLGKTSSRGDALLPSRLLLSGDPQDLSQRVTHLFRAPPLTRQLLPSTTAWPFRLPAPPQPPQQLSVTALRDYLTCPFRYYLSHGLGMRRFDPFKQELDALDFGNLCHYALEQLNQTAAGQNATGETEIRDLLLAALTSRAAHLYGPDPSLAIRIQLESAAARLHAAAIQIAHSRADGWFPLHVEWKFHQHTPLEIGGLPLRGKIDLIEENRHSRQWRLLDYKTSDTAVAPHKQHLRRIRSDDDPAPDYALLTLGGVDSAWSDLQLPLYRIAVSNAFDCDPQQLSIGYFNLPKAVSETGISMWEEYDPAYDASAYQCCEGIIASILAGQFWPPRDKVTYDDYAQLFLPDIEQAFHHDHAAAD